MTPVEDFYYGLGLVTASVITLIVWAMSEVLFDSDMNVGMFSGVIVMGLYFIYRGITRGRNR